MSEIRLSELRQRCGVSIGQAQSDGQPNDDRRASSRPGRCVVVGEPTDDQAVAFAGTARKAWEIYGPLAEEGNRNLGAYTAPQLELVIDFLHQSERLYEAHIARVRDMCRKQTEGA